MLLPSEKGSQSTDLKVGQLPVAMFLLLLSLLYYAAGESGPEYMRLANLIAPSLLSVVLAYFVVARLRLDSYNIWCPLTWFSIATCIAFGFGSNLWYWGSDELRHRLATLYPVDDHQILQTNLLNSIGLLFVIVGYSLTRTLMRGLPKSIAKTNAGSASRASVLQLVKPLVYFAIPYNIIYLPYLWGISPWTLSGVFLQLNGVNHLIVFGLAMLWGSGMGIYRRWAVAVCAILVVAAIPSFGKGAMLAPVVTLILGLYWGSRKIIILVKGMVTVFLLFAFIVSPLSAAGRAQITERGQDGVAVSERLALLGQHLSSAFSSSDDRIENDSLGPFESYISRNSFTTVQSYQIDAFDSGRPGESLQDFVIALVPRLLWKDKPIITDVGARFDALVKNMEITTSSLAPTFNGEAYWNGGWVMVAIVSLVIGAQFAHFAIASRNHLGANDYRYLFIAFAGIAYGLSIEAWLIPKYVGGYVTTWIMWVLIRRLIPWKQQT